MKECHLGALLRRVYTMKKLVLILAATVLIGVGAADASYAAPKSEALQIAKAGGLKQLKDVSRKKLEAAIRERPNMTTSNVITTIAVGTEVFSQQTGWSLASETAALGVLTVLSAMPTYKAERHTRLLVWMPRTEAESPEAAAKLLKTLVIDAYKKALPSFTVEMSIRHSKGFPDNPLKYLKVQGDACSDCGVYMNAVLHYEAKPKKKKAPKVLGGYDAYRWSVDGFRNASIAGYPMEAALLSPDDRLNVLTEVSRNLPEWIYLYVAPAENMAGFPILLNEGKPMFFIEPDENR
jgi:hypothetical protein